MKPLLVYLLTVNAAGYLLMLTDKIRSKKNSKRIPEKTLMTVAIIGGSIGTLTGMYSVRHKTRHQKFTIGVPVILAIQILVGILLIIL